MSYKAEIISKDYELLLQSSYFAVSLRTSSSQIGISVALLNDLDCIKSSSVRKIKWEIARLNILILN